MGDPVSGCPAVPALLRTMEAPRKRARTRWKMPRNMGGRHAQQTPTSCVHDCADCAGRIPAAGCRRPCGRHLHPCRSRRRLGPDRPTDGAGSPVRGPDLGRDRDQRRRRRRHRRTAAVREPLRRAGQRAHAGRHGDGGRHHRKQVAGDAGRRDAHRPADGRVPRARRARCLAVPDGRRFRRGAEGGPGGRSGRGRLGRRVGPYPPRPHRQDDRGVGGQHELRPLRGRRRGAGGASRQPGRGRHPNR